MENTINSLVMIATGEYSDYCTTPYKVLKPFTFRKVNALFLAQVPLDKGRKGYSTGKFTGWLNEQGYIEDYPCHEVHLGDPYELEVRSEMADVLFEPENCNVS